MTPSARPSRNQPAGASPPRPGAQLGAGYQEFGIFGFDVRERRGGAGGHVRGVHAGRGTAYDVRMAGGGPRTASA